MGLDGVELVMDVEDHFGIVISDDEVSGIQTVGDLVALIRGRVDARSASSCPYPPAFLALRRVVRDVVGDDTRRFRPGHLVVDQLSPAERRRLWERLPEELDTPPKGLHYPRPVYWTLVFLSVLLTVAAIGVASIDWAMLPLTGFAAIILICVLLAMTSPLCCVPDERMATLGDITRLIVGRTQATADLDLPDDSAILGELRPLVAEILGVDVGAVVPEARFVEDLGVG